MTDPRRSHSYKRVKLNPPDPSSTPPRLEDLAIVQPVYPESGTIYRYEIDAGGPNGPWHVTVRTPNPVEGMSITMLRNALTGMIRSPGPLTNRVSLDEWDSSGLDFDTNGDAICHHIVATPPDDEGVR